MSQQLAGLSQLNRYTNHPFPSLSLFLFLISLPPLLHLPPKRRRDLIRPPVHLDLTLVHVLVDPDGALADVNVLALALLEHLEDEVAADARVVGVAKVLVDALLERFRALAQFLGVVRVHELLEDGARVRRALRDGLRACAGLREERFGGFDEFLHHALVGCGKME
jgi:hypothetical protein